MRKKTNMAGLVSHTTPAGASYQSGKNRCEQNIKKLEKMIESGWEITDPKVKKEPKQVVVSLGGDWTVKMDITDYRQRGKGLKVILEIY